MDVNDHNKSLGRQLLEFLLFFTLFVPIIPAGIILLLIEMFF